MVKYWATFFYPDLDQKYSRFSLASYNKIITEKDIDRGWMLKEELIRLYPIIKTKCKENSGLVEYETCVKTNKTHITNEYYIR